MTLAIILDVAAEYLRQRNKWTKDQCRVMPDGEPAGVSIGSQFFVGLDELSIRPGDYRNQLQLQETAGIEIFIWRKSGQFPKDRQGHLIDKDNQYLNLLMPSSIERNIIRQIHGNMEIVTVANQQAGTNTDNSGSGFSLPLKLLGKSKQVPTTLDAGGPAPIPYVLRRLQFGGMYRFQYSDNIA